MLAGDPQITQPGAAARLHDVDGIHPDLRLRTDGLVNKYQVAGFKSGPRVVVPPQPHHHRTPQAGGQQSRRRDRPQRPPRLEFCALEAQQTEH